MDGACGIERRDPASGLIKLGLVMSHLQRRRQSGVLRVEDEGRTHLVRVSEGRIGGVRLNSDNSSFPGDELPVPSPEQLFFLARPRAFFEEKLLVSRDTETISAEKVVLHGVVRRRDLFDPRPLVERIPVDTLKLERETLHRLMYFGLSDLEIEFVRRLAVPTPVTMALWKRGLPPEHAGALLVALNVLGCFPSWQPGDLPRIAAVTRLLRKIRSRAMTHEILGVPADATREEVDRAFRKLSFELHPDRLLWLSEQERRDAKEAFEAVSAAHAEMKISRRSRRVRASRPPERERVSASPKASWRACLAAAKNFAAEGLHRQAAASVLRALSFTPPQSVVDELKKILRDCA